ncbi:MAG: retropepsin-like aspartic protease [Betaproteobacteria bacterium]|nr:retropepsin-like aspartic protease [Betaproteobacteria bacterium]
MIIERTLEFRGSKGRANLTALFDSGATYSCVNASDVDGLANREPLPDPIDVETASDGNFIRIVDRVGLDFYVDGLRMTDEFMVVPNLSESVIIGATTMQKWKIKLDFEHDTIILDPRVAKLKLV